jgi:hypothetical protein
VQNLKDHADWQAYYSESIQPLNELEKGKLCQDNDSSKSHSEENIFDDDFIRSDFAVDNTAGSQKELSDNEF